MELTISNVKMTSDELQEVTSGIFRLRTLFVNVYFIELEDSPGSWVLVDAGLKGYATEIIDAAETIFGIGTKPEAIILTHGHFDHIGSLFDLLDHWDVPIYAHRLEIPYLTGLSSYPPPDPTAGKGLMSLLSFLYPNKPINLGNKVKSIEDEYFPYLHGWRIKHTPGHAPGHISLFREKDKVLIAGDAFVTVQQESIYAIILQKEELCGPPAYFTNNWIAAEASIRMLADMEPSIVATGHGKPLKGMFIKWALHDLADHFKEKVVPKQGRYAREPALTDDLGVIKVPPVQTWVKTAGGIALALTAGLVSFALIRKFNNRKV